MSKNYKAIHYIQNKLKNYNPNFVKCVLRQFEMIDSTEEPDGGMSNSAVLYICAKEYGYNPKLCYGLCGYEDKKFYHTWLEIDDIVIDLSIYGYTNFGLFSCFFTNKMEVPYIGPYKNDKVQYGRFRFDEDWSHAAISFVEGLSLEKYMDGLPENAMWKYLCIIMDKEPSIEFVNHCRKLIADVNITRE